MIVFVTTGNQKFNIKNQNTILGILFRKFDINMKVVKLIAFTAALGLFTFAGTSDVSAKNKKKKSKTECCSSTDAKATATSTDAKPAGCGTATAGTAKAKSCCSSKTAATPTQTPSGN